MDNNNTSEIFNYDQVTAQMAKIFEYYNNGLGVMNEITDLLSSAVSNTENTAGATALGGNTKGLWDQWNAFYADFSKFGTSMQTMVNQVSTAKGNNIAFEAGNAGTIVAAVNASVTGTDQQ